MSSAASRANLVFRAPFPRCHQMPLLIRARPPFKHQHSPRASAATLCSALRKIATDHLLRCICRDEPCLLSIPFGHHGFQCFENEPDQNGATLDVHCSRPIDTTFARLLPPTEVVPDFFLGRKNGVQMSHQNNGVTQRR